jgi:hypothetical protein
MIRFEAYESDVPAGERRPLADSRPRANGGANLRHREIAVLVAERRTHSPLRNSEPHAAFGRDRPMGPR